MDNKGSDSEERIVLTPGSSSSTSVGLSGDEMSDTSSNVTASVNAENYITLKEGTLSAFTAEELSEAVERCKELVLESEECSEERKWLVRRLIELRHRLQQAQEISETNPQGIDENVVHLGHHFNLQYNPMSTRKTFCDKCCRNIWNVVQSWYYCTDCHYKCHVKCLQQVKRVCVHLTYSENPQYEKRICPEKGLADQGYRCFECHAKISCKGDGDEARLCDYSGRYFCTSCHWNTPAVIPARASRNWDFEPKLVSRSSYQLIKLTKSRPMLILDPRLYGFIEELTVVKKRREELYQMKQYIATCRIASENAELMREIEWRHHLIHNMDIFSLNDLMEIHSGKLIEKMNQIHATIVQHIKEDCDVCKGRGYICELCDLKQILYPFDSNTHTCLKCGEVLHKMCWSKKEICPRCERRAKKKLEEIELD